MNIGIVLIIFFVGFFVGFLLSSFLISWYHQERDSHVIRLQKTIDEMTAQLKPKQKSMERMNEEFGE